MSELNINNLPVEILIQVFRCLDAVALKNAALTCKLWNDIVVSECRWSLKMTYDKHGKLSSKYPFCDELKIDFIRTTKRKFRTIEIMGGHLTKDAQTHEIFQIHGLNVVKLCCYETNIDNLDAFAELLRLTPNLKHAYLTCVDLPSASDDVALAQVLPDLKKLTYLDMEDSDPRIIKCFQKAKLTAIIVSYINCSYYNSDSVHSDLLVQFLLSQEMLTSLTEYGFEIIEKLGKLHASIPFRLSQLAIMGYRSRSPTFTDLLLRFVQSQAASLKELEMGENIPSAVYECVFASMPQLNTLIIERMPKDNELYKRLKENCSVHKMVLMNDFVAGSISVMAQNLSKLESLSIGLIDKRCSIDCTKFSNLKALEIQYLSVKVDWNEFTKINSRLTELTIGCVRHWTDSCFTTDDMDQITTNVDLQKIRLGDAFVADDRFFEIIRAKCTNLKVLDLHKSCVSNRLREKVDIKVLRFCDEIRCSKMYS